MNGYAVVIDLHTFDVFEIKSSYLNVGVISPFIGTKSPSIESFWNFFEYGMHRSLLLNIYRCA